MDNIWEIKGRTFYEDDGIFQIFYNRLFNESWTFKDVLKISTFARFKFKNRVKAKAFKSMENSWLTLVRLWNTKYKMVEIDRICGFMAIVFLFVVLPYNLLDDVNKYFNNFEINKINICYFFYTSGKNLELKNVQDVFEIGPTSSEEWIQWLNMYHKNASWWLCYMIYERNNNLKSLVD